MIKILAMVALVVPLMTSNSFPTRPLNHLKLEPQETIATGTWGGDQISMEVTTDGATIEYPCAHGIVSHQLVADTKGNFKAKGFYFREGPGAEREDAEREGDPVVYSGKIEEKTLTLTVRKTNTQEIIGSYRLVFGKKSRIVKCK